MIEGLESVRGCPRVNVRAVGKKFDVRAHVLLDADLKFADVHRIASSIGMRIKRMVPHARVFIHTEPAPGGNKALTTTIREISENVPRSRGVHNIHIQRLDGRLGVDMHLEIGASATIEQAHETVVEVEKRLRRAVPHLGTVNVHIESASDRIANEISQVDPEIRWYVEHVAKHSPGVERVSGVKVSRVGGQLHVVFKCFFAPDTSVQQAHAATRELEEHIRRAYPNVARIAILEEPANN